jgi:hypothetical protein
VLLLDHPEQALGRFPVRFVGHVVDGQATARHQDRPAFTSDERAQAGNGGEKRASRSKTPSQYDRINKITSPARLDITPPTLIT